MCGIGQIGWPDEWSRGAPRQVLEEGKSRSKAGEAMGKL